MKIVTWNVNGIRAIWKKNFLTWLKREDPDVLCIQETKAQQGQLADEILNIAGYSSQMFSAKKKGYSGVMAYFKHQPQEIRPLGNELFDSEGRAQILIYDHFSIFNAYFPNSQEKGKRLDYKLAFCKEVLEVCKGLEREGHLVILCGDYNIAHKPIDLARPESNEESPGYLPEERKWMDQLISNGFVDLFREFSQEGDRYTWWSYRTKARERNIGWRIDYHCCSNELKERIKSCTILDDVHGSDHCPVRLVVA